MPDEMDICLVCLRADLKLQVINPRLTDFHEELCDYSYYAIGSGDPKYCLECEHLLRKLYNFKEKCKLAITILQKWKNKKDEKKPFSLLYTLLPQSGLGLWMSTNTKTLQFEEEPRLESKNSLPSTAPVLNSPQLELAPNNKPWLVTDINVLEPRTLLKNEPRSLEPNVTVPRSSGTSVNMPWSSGTRANVLRPSETSGLTENQIPDIKLEMSGEVDLRLGIKEVTTPFFENIPEHKYKCNNDEAPGKNDVEEQIKDETEIIEYLDYTLNSDDDSDTSEYKINCTNVEVSENNDVEVQIKDDAEIIVYPDDTSLKNDDDSETDYTYSSIQKQVDDIETDSIINSDDIQEIDKALDDSSVDSDDNEAKVKKENENCSSTDNKSRAELALTTLSDDDFISNNETDIEDKEANVSNDDQNEEWTTANKIIADMENINAELDSINDNNEKIVVESDAVSKNGIDFNIQNNKKHSRNGSFGTSIRNINDDIDAIQFNCEKLIGRKVEGSSRRLLKEDLRSKFESCGELTSVNGVVIDKEHVLNCIDGRATEYLIQCLWRAAYRKKSFSQKVIKMLAWLQNKYKNDKFESVFDIEYMNTPEAMREEFQRRKTYEWYIKAKHKCELCYTVFKYEQHLEKHKKLHDESSGDHVCTICGVRHKLKKQHKHHMLSHSAVYKCKQCPLVTYHKATVTNHYNQHKGMKYRCETCDKSFSSASGYNSHRGYVHRRAHVCTACGRTFDTEETLNTHKNTFHRVKPATDDSSCVKCDKCELSFPSQAVYERHIRFTHGAPFHWGRRKNNTIYRKNEEPAITRIIKMKIKEKAAAYTCPECKAVGGTYGWLVLHGRLEHNKDLGETYAQKRKYLCDYCAKGFASKYNLRDHLYTHTGERPFACDSCPKRFHSSMKLKNHRKFHLPPSQLCAECGKNFRSYANLYNHMKIHIGDRRYKCDVCGKGFLSSTSLKEHVRGVHEKVRRKRKRGVSETREIGVSETREKGVSETREKGVSETGEIGVPEAVMRQVTTMRVTRASTMARKMRRKVRKVVSSTDEIGDSD